MKVDGDPYGGDVKTTTKITIAAAVILAASTAGVVGWTATQGGDKPSASAARATSASPTPSPVDLNREACHSFSINYDPNDIDSQFNPGTWRIVAQVAQHATDTAISSAADRLFDVALANEKLSEDDRRGMANLSLDRARLDLAQACGDRFGDGPW